MTEPYTDLPALGVVAVGLIVFSYVMLSAYSSYTSSTYYAGMKGDLMSVARTAESDPSIAIWPGMLDARLLDNATNKDLKYGYPGAAVELAIDAGNYHWRLGHASSGTSSSYVGPVSVRLNDARCEPGTLKVTMWER